MNTISAQIQSVKLNIGGMTCVHCQEKIESALAAAEGVTEAKVSYGNGTAEITFDGAIISLEDIRAIIEGLDYEVLPDGKKNVKPIKVLYPFIIFAVIVALFIPLQYFGVLSMLAPGSVADSTMGYGMLFVIGLITSVHCIAMCGGINLSQCLPKSEDNVKKGFRTFLPALFYNLGRVISYTFIGLVLGFIGWIAGGAVSAGISNVIQGIFKLIAGVLMIIMGVNMLGIIPALRKINPRLPKFISKRIGKSKASCASPFIVGILNGIMPCGPLQSMWLVALATCNPFKGALSMFLFSVGTVPLMLGLGSIVAKLGQKFTKAVMTVGSVLVVVLGLAMLTQGGSLTGVSVLSPVIISAVVLALIFGGVICSMPLTQKPLKIVMRITACCLVAVVGVFSFWAESRSVSIDDYSVVDGEVQTVTSVLDSYNSYPNISVKKGIPVVWTITVEDGKYIGYCNYEIKIPEYGIVWDFTEGDNVIEFTPEKTGTFNYSCWMGMITAYIVVT